MMNLPQQNVQQNMTASNCKLNIMITSETLKFPVDKLIKHVKTRAKFQLHQTHYRVPIYVLCEGRITIG